MRDLLVVRVDPTRIADPEIAGEGEGERLKALAAAYSREDLMRTFDLLSRSEYEIRQSSQPRHQFEMMLVKWIHLRQLTPLTDIIQGAAVPAPRGPNPSPGAASLRTVPPAPAPGPTSKGSAGTSPSIRAAARSASAPCAPSSWSPAPASGATPASSPAAAPGATPKPAPAPGAARDGAGGGEIDLKTALLGTIREQNKVFHGMVIAQAQKVEVEGDTVVFTFAPVHRSLKGELEKKRGWIEQLAQAAAGRRIAVVTRESEAAPTPAAADADAASSRRADLAARARAEPTVQAVLDVFGGEIEDVEEM
jgi:DNA polymerase III gamma/tau subunit